MKVKKISDEKRNFGKKSITIIGLIVSLTGAIFTIYIGIDGLINGAWWEQYYFNILIFFGVLALIGVIIGFFRKAIGIGITLFVGIVGLINAPLLFSGFGIMSYLVFLILIGGIVGFSANYENLKAWKEQNYPSKHKREAGWEKKLILPGVIFLILGGIIIFIIIWQVTTVGEVFFALFFVAASTVFIITGLVLIIYSVIKLRK